MPAPTMNNPLMRPPVRDYDESQYDATDSDTDTEWTPGAGPCDVPQKPSTSWMNVRTPSPRSFCDDPKKPGTSWTNVRTPSPRSFCDEPRKPGTSWMSMRTPSPVTPRYGGYAGCAPPSFFASPAFFLQLPPTMLQQPYTALKDVVANAPWRRKKASSESDTPSTTASTESEGGYGVFEEQLPGPNDTAEDAPPSKGSIGHPHCCAQACKYHKKPRGCKDGANCDRCHICVFQVVKPRRKTNEDLDVPPPPPRTHARSRRRKINQAQAGATFCAPCN